jgi:hypothetical protein
MRRTHARYLLECRALRPLPVNEHVKVARLSWQLMNPGVAIVVIHKNVLCTAFDSGSSCSKNGADKPPAKYI